MDGNKIVTFTYHDVTKLMRKAVDQSLKNLSNFLNNLKNALITYWLQYYYLLVILLLYEVIFL